LVFGGWVLRNPYDRGVGGFVGSQSISVFVKQLPNEIHGAMAIRTHVENRMFSLKVSGDHWERQWSICIAVSPKGFLEKPAYSSRN
jgi:hypothetical protein